MSAESSSSLGWALISSSTQKPMLPGPGELGGAEVAGGEIEQGQGRHWAGDVQGGQVVVPFRSQRRIEAVPGVRTRVTSRRTIFLVSLGSSICSQMATR